MEQLTWQQLGRHTKPVLLANIDGFWEPLLALLAHMRATEFIRPTLAVDILKAERVEDILPRLRAAARAPSAQGTGARNGAPAQRRRLCFTPRKRHRLDAVAVGIDDEGRVIAHAIVRAQARRAVGAASGIQRRGMECIDLAGRFRPKTDMDAALRRDRRHTGAQIDPELGIALAETDRAGRVTSRESPSGASVAS